MANNEKGVFEMNPEKEKAVASTTALKHKQRRGSYRKAIPLSSLKEQVGQILLNLQGTQQTEWQVLESMLRRYVDLNYCEGSHHG